MIKILIRLLFVFFSLNSARANETATIEVNAVVPAVLYISLIPTIQSQDLPTSGTQSSLKVADLIIKSNYLSAELSINCDSLYNGSCFLLKPGETALSATNKIQYSVSTDQAIFNGITDYSGSMNISYSPAEGLSSGNYQDTIRVSIMAIE